MSIVALERNRFFFGKMMDVAQFEKEQAYFRNQIALLTRLAIGTGVVSGLEVTADATTRGNVSIAPGVAIDSAGRFLMVPASVSVNPAQITDSTGNPQGSPLTSGTTLLCLSYTEACADPVAVMGADCDAPGACAPSSIREGYQVLVSAAPKELPVQLNNPIANFRKLTPEQLQSTLAQIIAGVSPDAQSTCVPLARVTLPALTIDAASDRPLVYNNPLLMQMILSLKSSS